MRRSFIALFAGFLSLAAGSLRVTASHEQAGQITIAPDILKYYQWRSIGPERGGRSIAISGVKGRPSEGYFGATGRQGGDLVPRDRRTDP